MKQTIELKEEDWFPVLVKALGLNPEKAYLYHVASIVGKNKLTFGYYEDIDNSTKKPFKN